MVKIHRLFASAALVTATLMAAPAIANEQGQHCDLPDAGKMGERGGKHNVHAKLQALNLTDAQKAQIKDLMEKQKPQRVASWKEMRESGKALHEAARSESYDAAKVRELANRQAQLKAEMTVQRIETMHQVYALLTPEQKQKWDAQRNSRHGAEKS